MEQNENKRPTARRESAVTRERTRRPGDRPRSSRPRTGNAQDREAQRRRRQAQAQGQEPQADRSSRPSQTREPSAHAGRRAEAARTRQPGSQANRRRRKKPHRVYNTNFGFKFITMLAVVAAIVVSMIIFFKVKHINVVMRGIEVKTDLRPVATEARQPDSTGVTAAPSNAPADTQTATETGSTEATEATGETAGTEEPASTEATGETGQTAESAAPEATGESAPPETQPTAPAPEFDTELVQGHSYYTAQEIIEASGINLDDNLLSLSKATVAARIHAALPYVNEIQIKKQLPGTVIITVSEFEVTYGIQDEAGDWWLMSREGRILEPATEQSVRGHLLITGMPIQVPKPGDWFKPAATEGADMAEIAAKQKVVLEVIPVLEEAPFVKELASVDVSTSYNLTLWYGTRYEIWLGTAENLDYKFRFLEAALADKEIQRRSGTIDLTFSEDEKAHFMEFR